MSPLDRPVHVTIFPNLAATERQSLFVSLRTFAEQLRDGRAPSKDRLRLFSMCSYDSKRTAKGALRHDRNIRECFALVGDYDGGMVPLIAAEAALQRAGIAGLLVTTPSHTKENPRWRVIAPLSDPLHHARANATGYQLVDHARLVSRLAGIFPDSLAAESWALSQSWYVGTVEGAAAHGVVAIDGVCIDTRPDLDASARPKPTPAIRERARPTRATPRPTDPSQPDLISDLIPDEALPLNVGAALEAVTAGEGSHDALVRVAGKLAAQGVPETTAVAILTFAADQRPPERRDAGWEKLRADIPRTVRWAADKEAGTEAAAAPQAAASSLGNGAAPPPPHPPDAVPGAPPPQGQPQPGGRVVLRNRNPKHAGNLANVITFLLQHPALIGCVMFDRMACSISLRQALPGAGTLIAPRPWIDDDTSRLQDFLQREGQMARVGKETVQQGAEAVAQMYPFHPVQDYLRGRIWDGIPRADMWLTQYLGVEPSEYAKATGRMWLIGMVARIEQPGCKFDYMLIFEGLQGTLKSQVCVALCGPWVSDQSLDIRHDARAASQHLRNKWLVEVSELTFFRQADVETLKAFITRTHERYLPRYARNEVIEPRQCGFLGTTNQDVYLHDPTGNRRFWPHRTGKIDVRALLRDRDQLWAEVVAAYHSGEHWWPDADFEARVIQPEQAARYDADGWTPLIEQYLTGKTQVTLIDVFRRALADPYDPARIELPPERFDRKAQIRVREILQNLGWKRGPRTGTARVWVKPP